ncbi:MAG: cytidine deaminase [Synergistaceae bacterium]|nr:cytidine deaminase [Synergistaceae bacterium]
MNPLKKDYSWPADWPSINELLEAAREARARSYSPYSRFPVGAALFVEGMDELIPACNVENSSYGLSICAERSAATAMIARGGRKPLAAAIVGVPGEPCLPCGACRQFLAEFNPDMVLVFEDGDSYVLSSLADLFPAPFLFGGEADEH